MYEPELYSNNNKVTVEAVKFSLKKYFNIVKFNKSEVNNVVDVGFGDGNATEILFEYLPLNINYVGIDVSDEMIKFAKKRKLLQGKELHKFDITSKHLPDQFFNKFENCFAFNLFHGIRDVRQALQNIYKMMKPDGNIYLTFFEFVPSDVAFQAVTLNSKWSKYETDKLCSFFYKKNINVADFYEEMMKEIGFNKIMCYQDEFRVQQDIAAFKNLMISVNRIIRNVPEEDRDEYIEDYFSAIINQHCIELADDDNVIITLPHLTVYGSK